MVKEVKFYRNLHRVIKDQMRYALSIRNIRGQMSLPNVDTQETRARRMAKESVQLSTLLEFSNYRLKSCYKSMFVNGSTPTISIKFTSIRDGRHETFDRTSGQLAGPSNPADCTTWHDLTELAGSSCAPAEWCMISFYPANCGLTFVSRLYELIFYFNLLSSEGVFKDGYPFPKKKTLQIINRESGKITEATHFTQHRTVLYLNSMKTQSSIAIFIDFGKRRSEIKIDEIKLVFDKLKTIIKDRFIKD